MGRSRSRRRRGKSGGQGSGGSGKGKGTGGSRGRSSGTRGGAGKGGSGSGKGTGGSRGRSNNTRGGQAKANRNQNKKARRTVRSVKKAVGRVAKGVGKAIGSVTRGAAAKASDLKGKPKSKLQQQLSNLRKDIAQKSTKKARFQRRQDRLKRQFGLDYSNMKDSFRADVNVRQAYKHYNLDKFAPTRAIYNRLPKAVKNFSWKHQFKAPTKLGISDGFRKKNRGGKTIAANTRDQLSALRIGSETPGFQPTDMQYRGPDYQEARREDDFARQQREFDRETQEYDSKIRNTLDEKTLYENRLMPLPSPSPERGYERGLPDPDTIGGILPRKPKDTIELMYENILGRKADQGGLDYWKNELRSGRQTRDDIRRNIIRSDEFQGRSEAEKRMALHGVKRRRFQRDRIGRGKPPRGRTDMVRPLPWIGPRRNNKGNATKGSGFTGHLGIGIPGSQWKRSTPKGKARPRGKNPRGGGSLASIALGMATRGWRK